MNTNNSNDIDTPPTAFVGWMRAVPASKGTRGLWSAVCVGHTWDDCWCRVLCVDACGCPNVERVVLPGGVHPEAAGGKKKGRRAG